MLRDSVELVGLLQEAKRLLGMSQESALSSTTPREAMAIIEREAEALKREGRVKNRNELKVLFGPTGPIQEIALSGGWERKYIELAAKFDTAIERCQ